MDTTSYDRNWQLFYFGEHSQSLIRDIAIINENDIWAVGEIYMNDSLGNPDANAYNAVHWDGQSWQLLRLRFYTFCGQPNTGPYPIKSIIAFNENNIWLTSNSQITHFDGVNQLSIQCLPVSVERIWGTNDNNIYLIGANGKIAHYNGVSWSSMESGTEVDLLDIWGGSDGTLWASGYSGDYGTTVLLRNSVSSWVKVFEGTSSEQNNGFTINLITGVWSKNIFRIYLMKSDGIFLQANQNELFLQKRIAKFRYGSYSISGTDDNNIFVSGWRYVGHWNGISYREYPELYQGNRDYYSIKAKGNTVCAGGSDYNGYSYSQAVIAIGIKN